MDDEKSRTPNGIIPGAPASRWVPSSSQDAIFTGVPPATTQTDAIIAGAPAAASVADLPQPWYRSWWHIVYFSLVGMACAVFLLIALVAPNSKAAGSQLCLMFSAGILDLLLPIPIAVGVFRRRFWRFRNHPTVNWCLSFILLAPCLYVVWGLVFVVWISLAWPGG